MQYIKIMLEAVSWVYHKYITAATKACCTFRRIILVQPKEKQDKENVCECVYSIPCKSFVIVFTSARREGVLGKG